MLQTMGSQTVRLDLATEQQPPLEAGAQLHPLQGEEEERKTFLTASDPGFGKGQLPPTHK